MGNPAQPDGQLTREQAEQQAERIIELGEAEDTAGLVGYLQENLPEEKWDAMVFLFSRTTNVHVTIFRGTIAVSGDSRLRGGTSVSDLASILQR